MSISLLVVLGAAVLTRSPQPEAPLAGPRIAERAARPTIVQRGVNGELKQPEGSLEEAAVAQLKLEGDPKAKVEAVFATRALALESFIEDNFDLMVRLVGSGSAPGKEKLALAWEALQKFKPVTEPGPLDAQVRSALPENKAREFDRLMKEFYNAAVADDKATPKPKGRIGIILEERFKSLGRELEAAYKRCERSGAVLYHYLFDSIGVTPEQEKHLRSLCATYAMGGLDDKDKKAQGVMFANVVQVLTPEQAAALGRKFKGGMKYEKAKKPKEAVKEPGAGPMQPQGR
jgi:hypothetical protein